MEADTQEFLLSEDKMKQIRIFCDVAEANGSHLTLKELITLLSLDITESKLFENWGNLEGLEGYIIAPDFIIHRKQLTDDFGIIQNEYRSSRARAVSNFEFSHRFASLCNKINVRVLSVSGSTSYQSVAKGGDLDFFSIMNAGSLWPSFVKFLLLARAFRLVHRESPSICLSYVADERFAIREFTKPQDALFARDAIYTSVLRGEKYYARLLKSSSWMSKYFPMLYEQRVQDVEQERRPAIKTSTLARITNLFVYFIAGKYVRLKSHLLNRRYAKEKKWNSLFRVRIGPDHCIYESERYLHLRQMYLALDDTNDFVRMNVQSKDWK